MHDGRSIDTSMGFTPLEGLPMNTRCGDLDPGAVLHLLRRWPLAEVQNVLYRESGLLGLSGTSGDLRVLEPAAAGGDARAVFALQAQAYRIRKYIGAYAVALEGLDAVVVSGALAENWAPYRARILRGLECLGLKFDAARNEAAVVGEASCVSAVELRVVAFVVPNDEERQIAHEVHDLLA